MIISKISGLTGRLNTMDIPISKEQLDRWYNGQLIQYAMPNLTPDEREFLLTGSTPEEFHEALGDEE